MRLKANRKISLLAASLLGVGGGLGGVMVFGGQSERPRTTNPPSQEKTEDWKSKLSAEEISALSRTESPNDHVKTYLRLAEQRLKNTRDYLAREEYSDVGAQVVAYTALIADAGQYAKTSVPKKDKAHKTLETNLREQLRTLEGIRRDVTTAQAETLDKAIKIVNQVRRQSLNLLLGADGGILSETDKQE